MDFDFWARWVHPAQRISDNQAALMQSEYHIILDASDGDDDARACFPCAFCNADFELPMLCVHMLEQHCFEFKTAWRRYEKFSSSSMLDKKLWAEGGEDKQESALDPLLSPFICSILFSDHKSVHTDECSIRDASVLANEGSADPDLVEEDHDDERDEKRRQRAAFVRQLLASSMLLEFPF